MRSDIGIESEHCWPIGSRPLHCYGLSDAPVRIEPHCHLSIHGLCSIAARLHFYRIITLFLYDHALCSLVQGKLIMGTCIRSHSIIISSTITKVRCNKQAKEPSFLVYRVLMTPAATSLLILSRTIGFRMCSMSARGSDCAC